MRSCSVCSLHRRDSDLQWLRHQQAEGRRIGYAEVGQGFRHIRASKSSTRHNLKCGQTQEAGVAKLGARTASCPPEVLPLQSLAGLAFITGIKNISRSRSNRRKRSMGITAL